MRSTDSIAALARHALDYNPETGVFTWKNPTSSKMKPGDVAGAIGPKSYLVISLGGYKHLAHRLAWLYVHGEWPKSQLDHKDGNKRNNRLGNLREASASQNKQNMSNPRSDNSTGYLGVTKNSIGWCARIKVGGKLKWLGAFETPELASAAYWNAKRQFHEFCPELA